MSERARKWWLTIVGQWAYRGRAANWIFDPRNMDRGALDELRAIGLVEVIDNWSWRLTDPGIAEAAREADSATVNVVQVEMTSQFVNPDGTVTTPHVTTIKI